MTNEVISCLCNRRSVKKYSSRPVEEEKLEAILTAGTFAANGRGRQSAVIVCVENKEDREALRRMNSGFLGASEMDPFYGAPVVVIVLADKNINTYLEDGSLVMGNLMNAANSLGVDSCWIHRAKEEFDSAEGRALLKKWGIEGNYAGIGHCILGYCDGEKPQAKPRKENYIYRIR